MQLERQPLAGSGATTAQPSWRVQRASLDDAHSTPKTGTQPAAEPFLTFAVPDDLFARLDKLSSEQRRLLPELLFLCIPGQAGPRWLQYVTQPRALVHTRPTPAGDEFQGMRTMLMMPSWLAAPFKEAMSRRRRREVTPLQQRQFARLERLLE